MPEVALVRVDLCRLCEEIVPEHVAHVLRGYHSAVLVMLVDKVVLLGLMVITRRNKLARTCHCLLGGSDWMRKLTG